jgi:protein involved in polysaccharide export with SLBB domain
MRSIITLIALVLLTAMWSICDCGANSGSSPDEQVQPDIFVIGAVHTPGRYGWTNGMTAFDGIKAAGGFTDSAGERIEIFHIGDTKGKFFDRSVITNQPPVLSKGDQIFVRPKARRIF